MEMMNAKDKVKKIQINPQILVWNWYISCKPI